MSGQKGLGEGGRMSGQKGLTAIYDDSELNIVKTALGRRKRVFYDLQTGEIISSIAKIKRQLKLDAEGLSLFILLGFVPGTKTLFRDIECLPGGSTVGIRNRHWYLIKKKHYWEMKHPDDISEWDREKLFIEVKTTFLSAIERLYKNNQPIFLPLSGGLDSRAILAGLMQYSQAKNINTITWGIPGSLDYQRGYKVARAAGTNHTQISLHDIPITLDKMMDAARMTDGNANLFDSYYNYQPLMKCGASKYWSGYMGDGSCGSNRPITPIRTDDELVDLFIKKNNQVYNPSQIFVKKEAIELCRDTIINDAHVIKPLNSITPCESIDFMHRKERLIASIVVPSGIPVYTPYIDENWLKLILSLDPNLRVRRRYFIRFLIKLCPLLMAIPTTEFWGFPMHLRMLRSRHERTRITKYLGRKLGMYKVPLYHSYIDFNEGIRSRTDLKNIVRQSVHDLDKREIFPKKEPIRLLKDHIDKKGNYGMSLCLLTSLEIILKTYGIKT